MQIKRRAITVGTTFFLAAATGHVMQNGETISARLRGAPVPEKPVLASVESTAATITPAAVPAATGTVAATGAAAVPAEPAAAPAAAEPPATRIATSVPEQPKPEAAAAAPQPAQAGSGLPDLPRVEPAALGVDLRLAGRIEKLDTRYTRPETAADAAYSVFGIACTDPTLALDPSARGMLKVTLSAPCFANERVTITQAGLVFAASTDQGGELKLMLPAMSATAPVEVRFASGEMVSASRSVTGLDALARVAVQWRGSEGLHLHALENGAGFDMPGHVSVTVPRDRMTRDGGFLTVLGDPGVDHPLMAEVYTAPAGTALGGMVVEAPVSAGTCARRVAGQVLRMVPAAAPATETLSFAMPGCDAVGDSLMLGLSPVAVPAVALAAGGN
ncbi:hypothetical protein [Albidovulum sp.]|jgi:hypothetical protein|uniref:hypothetical protein n=1 Tax=Albidovulum sp. TaxID=1872424 RepID=UPI0039B9467F